MKPYVILTAILTLMVVTDYNPVITQKQADSTSKYCLTPSENTTEDVHKDTGYSGIKVIETDPCNKTDNASRSVPSGMNSKFMNNIFIL